MGVQDKFNELSDTVQPSLGGEVASTVRPLTDAPFTEMDPVLRRHLDRLEQNLAQVDFQRFGPQNSESVDVLAEADPFTLGAGVIGGAAAGLLGLFGISSWAKKWYKNKSRLLKDFDPDDFERLFEERMRPLLKQFIEDIIIEKLTDKMPPEWWVSFSRRHAIKRRVAEKMDMMISREIAPKVMQAFSDVFNEKRDMMEKELKLMIMRQGERPAGKPKMSGWGAAKEKGVPGAVESE